LLDALNIDFVNNTIASNSTTASSGILFNTLGGPLASTSGPTCTANCGVTSLPQVSGLVSIQNSVTLTANLPTATNNPGGLPVVPTVTCPAGHYSGTTAANGDCRSVSYPLLANNVFWQNSAYYIGVGALSAQFQQNVVSLYNAFTSTQAPTQTTTGQCTTASYWDIGVRGDTGPTDHSSAHTLNPTYSVLTNTAGYATTNIASNPSFVSQYCDGSRTPPEFGASGWAVPPGISDATVPNPIFNLTPVATVDEGNNWVNMRWGPLTMLNPVTSSATANVLLGNYAPAAGSPVIDHIPATVAHPTTDYFGNPRPDPGSPASIDIGAIEVQSTGSPVVAVTPTSLAFGNQSVGTTSAVRTLTLSNTGTGPFTGITLVMTAPFSRPTAGGTCTTTLAAGATCTINVVFAPTALGAVTGTATITGNATVTGSPVALSGTGTAAAAPVVAVTPTSLAFGNVTVGTNSASRTLTLSNTGTAAFPITAITVTAPFNRPGGGGGGTCGATLAAAATCTINVRYSPTATGASTGTVTITGTGATVTGSPVSLTGTGVAGAAIANVSGGPLAFGNWGIGQTSNSHTLTLHNTGTAALTGVGLTFTGPYSRPGTGGGSCGAILNAGANCTINVVFHPTALGAANGTLAIAGSVTVTGSPVTLTGAGVAAGAVSLTPSPLAITDPTGNPFGTGTITVRNTSAAGGSQVAVTNVAIAGGSLALGWTITVNPAGTNNCAGAVLAPNATCTISVAYTNLTATRPGSHSGTVIVTDSVGMQTDTVNVTVH
jgi:hypothetical protein